MTQQEVISLYLSKGYTLSKSNTLIKVLDNELGEITKKRIKLGSRSFRVEFYNNELKTWFNKYSLMNKVVYYCNCEIVDNRIKIGFKKDSK